MRETGEPVYDTVRTVEALIALQEEAKGGIEPFERCGLIFVQEYGGVLYNLQLADMVGLEPITVRAYVANARTEAGDMMLMLSFWAHRCGLDVDGPEGLVKMMTNFWPYLDFSGEKTRRWLTIQMGLIARSGIYSKNYAAPHLVEMERMGLKEAISKFLNLFCQLFHGVFSHEDSVGGFTTMIVELWQESVERYFERMHEFQSGVLKAKAT